MNKYQITLTPVDKFFFGGDMTFHVSTQEKKFNEKYSSYIIESSLFPQQTSLLGMLRFLILRNGGTEVFAHGKIVNEGNAEKLIGEKSFSVNTEKNGNHKKNTFGKISSISHVRILRTVNDKSFELEYAPMFTKINLDNSSEGIYNDKKALIPNLSKKEYDAKKEIEAKLTDGVNDYKIVAEYNKDEEKWNGIFVPDRRIGIDRNIETGQTKDDALFKQISYRFNSDAQYCFVFDTEIEDDVPLENYDAQLVSVGGDNSQFVIGIRKGIASNNSVKSMSNAIVLLSPTFLKREEAQLASFAVTKLIPFRFLESNINAKSYHILSKELTRSNKYELYAPGSVFYFKDNDPKKQLFMTSIESKEDFRQIGYNAYQA